jgi:hypothetical protein
MMPCYLHMLLGQCYLHVIPHVVHPRELADQTITCSVLTNPIPFAACAPNTLAVTLRPTVSIYQSCLSDFTITGLRGSTTPDNSALPINHLSPHTDATVLSTSAKWEQSTGSLTISLTGGEAQPMLAGESYIFSFDLVNGFSDQHSPTEMVVSSRQDYITTHEAMDNDPTVPTGIYNAQANDLYPMYIRNVSWEVRNIGQNSPYRKCTARLRGVCVVLPPLPVISLFSSYVCFDSDVYADALVVRFLDSLRLQCHHNYHPAQCAHLSFLLAGLHDHGSHRLCHR